MKPHTNIQKEIVQLAQKLPELTERQKAYAYGIDTSKVPMNIKRYRIQCSRFNFSQGEEFALIAHELGHANIKKNNIQCKGLQEEFEADDYAVGLGLRSELKSALENICRGYQDISGGFFDMFGLQDPKKDLEERITRL